MRRDQRRVFLLLAAVCAASWAWSFRMAAAAGQASPHHQHGAVWPLALMWAGMMVAMMVPPEVPRFLRLVRQERRDPLLYTLAFLVGYLAPWMLASLGAALLLVAGAMQLSAFKRVCLERCRSRAALPGPAGETPVASFLRGMGHGAVSIGSCGLLMLVLFVTGVMSPVAMALLTTLLLLENVAPVQWPVRWVAGVLLLGWGASLFLV